MIDYSHIPLLHKAEVAVVGGGPAGVCAAISAARNGAKTVLIEQTGCFGGMATAGLVPAIIHLNDRVHWVGAGLPCEIVGEMNKRMGGEEIHPIWQHVNPEILKKLLDEKLAEAGVEPFLELKLADVITENGSVKSVLTAGCNGLRRIEADIFIDCTGNGLLSALAGAEWECGDENGIPMSPSLCVQYSNIDLAKMRAANARHEGASELWFKHKEEIPLEEYHIVGISEYGNGSGSGNLGHIYGLDPLDEKEITRGYTEGRRVAHIIYDFYKKFVPGYENADLVASAPLLGIRESRRITGDIRLTLDDYQNRRHFADDIGHFYYPIDIHSSSTDAEEQKKVCKRMESYAYKPGENYGIPYRALTVKGFSNLLVAGRCISCDRYVGSSLRVMSAAMITGRAAGTAAALSVSSGNIRNISIENLQERLRRDGAWL